MYKNNILDLQRPIGELNGVIQRQCESGRLHRHVHTTTDHPTASDHLILVRKQHTDHVTRRVDDPNAEKIVVGHVDRVLKRKRKRKTLTSILRKIKK